MPWRRVRGKGDIRASGGPAGDSFLRRATTRGGRRTEENVALVGAVVPRQQVDLARAGRTEPWAVSKYKIGPADQALRIGIFHRGTNRRPFSAMRVDQRVRPVWIRKTMVLG